MMRISQRAQMGAKGGSTPSADSKERLGCAHASLAQVKISVFLLLFDTVQNLRISYRLDDQSQVKALFIGAELHLPKQDRKKHLTRTAEAVRPGRIRKENSRNVFYFICWIR